jgi:hypothetical protein
MTMTPEPRQFSTEQTAFLNEVNDRLLMPLTGPFAPDRTLRGRLVRSGILRQVDTVFGPAVGIGQVPWDQPWDVCQATTKRELSGVLAVAVLRAQLELQGFTFHRFRWPHRPGPHVDQSERWGIPDAVYLHAPPGLAVPVSARALRDRPDAGACLCLAGFPDPTEALIRRTLAEHRALQMPYAGPLVVGALKPERYRTLGQELNAEHWLHHPTGHLWNGWPLPLPPVLFVQLQLEVEPQVTVRKR